MVKDSMDLREALQVLVEGIMDAGSQRGSALNMANAVPTGSRHATR